MNGRTDRRFSEATRRTTAGLTAVEVVVVVAVVGVVFLSAFFVIRERERKMMLPIAATAPGDVFEMACELSDPSDSEPRVTCEITNDHFFSLPLRWDANSFETEPKQEVEGRFELNVLSILEAPDYDIDAVDPKIYKTEVPAKGRVEFVLSGEFLTDSSEIVIMFYPKFDDGRAANAGGRVYTFVGPHHAHVAFGRMRMIDSVFPTQPPDEELQRALEQQVLISTFETTFKE